MTAIRMTNWSKCPNKHHEESDVETKEIEKAKQLTSVKKRSNWHRDPGNQTSWHFDSGERRQNSSPQWRSCQVSEINEDLDGTPESLAEDKYSATKGDKWDEPSKKATILYLLRKNKLRIWFSQWRSCQIVWDEERCEGTPESWAEEKQTLCGARAELCKQG